MERTNEDAVELIDLGAASVETQGADFGKIDGVQLQQLPGLSDNSADPPARQVPRRRSCASQRCSGPCFHI